jgi:RNA recognition motif-containing protein
MKTLSVSEKLISSKEVPANLAEFSNFAVNPQVIEEIYERILIQEDIQGKKYKVSQTVKKIKKTYSINKRIEERRQWAKFGSALDDVRTTNIGDDVKFVFTGNETSQQEKEMNVILPDIRNKKEEESAEAFVPSAVFTPIIVKPTENPPAQQEEAIFVPDFLKISDMKKKYSVFIRDIPGDEEREGITDFLYEEAGKFGEVKFVKVLNSKFGQKSYIAFVDFCKEKDAEAFIQARVIYDKTILDKSWSKDKN